MYAGQPRIGSWRLCLVSLAHSLLSRASTSTTQRALFRLQFARAACLLLQCVSVASCQFCPRGTPSLGRRTPLRPPISLANCSTPGALMRLESGVAKKATRCDRVPAVSRCLSGPPRNTPAYVCQPTSGLAHGQLAFNRVAKGNLARNMVPGQLWSSLLFVRLGLARKIPLKEPLSISSGFTPGPTPRSAVEVFVTADWEIIRAIYHQLGSDVIAPMLR
ncbi:hypothetical protein B0H67DRAFT_238403 [Lasiosphaeris hirsuta]|uniref:Uncharacterized protein n=1 Tax=Lasiosphaeris hirsuta TaxID=260670 RepID=A0AA40AG97_9PEZI|nr:hypothetical protein B0H67DRAFT_238403 [Lasiosphaeris hirsuta]